MLGFGSAIVLALALALGSVTTNAIDPPGNGPAIDPPGNGHAAIDPPGNGPAIDPPGN